MDLGRRHEIRKLPAVRANGSRECVPDDRLREAIQPGRRKILEWRSVKTRESYFARYFRNTCVKRSGSVCGGMKPRYSPPLPIR
jgi:hypothetical protein